MTTAPAFWDRVAPKYAANPIKNIAGYEATLDRTRGYLAPDDSVLELGCGTGGTALALAPAVARYVASDISPAMIEIGREKARDASLPGLDFVQGTAEEGNLPPGPHDVVISFNHLHLLPDLPAGLGAIRALLKPGGLLISKTPCIAPWSPLRAVIGAMQLVGKAPHLCYVTPRALVRQIGAAGFDIVEAAPIKQGDNRPLIVARRR